MKRDRYLIYELLGKRVRATIPRRFLRKNAKSNVEGDVVDVHRDVIEHRVVVVIDDSFYSFREPSVVCGDANEVMLVYGADQPKETDDEFFDELRRVSNLGGDVTVALKNLKQDEFLIVRFEVIGDGHLRRGKKRKSRSSRKSGS